MFAVDPYLERILDLYSSYINERLSRELKYITLSNELKHSISDSIKANLYPYSVRVFVYLWNSLHVSLDKSSLSVEESYSEFRLRLIRGEIEEKINIDFPGFLPFIYSLVEQDIACLKEIFKSIVQANKQNPRGVPHLNSLRKVKLGLGDRHNGGQTTVKLTFTYKQNDLVFYWKPRCPLNDKVFHKVVSSVSKDLKFRLRQSSPIQAGDFCLQKSIQPTKITCTHSSGYRLGATLCISNMLSLNDLHHENIIFSGNNPYIIDTETLLYPRRNRADDLTRIYSESVLGSLLIPHIILGGPYKGCDISIFNDGTVDSKIEVPQFSYDPVSGPKINYSIPKNVARRNHDLVNLCNDKFISGIIEGFKDAAVSIGEKRYDLIELISEYESLLNSRYLFRTTRAYFTFMFTSVHPELFIESDTRRNFVREKLMKNNVTNEILELEIESIIKGDIPLFKVCYKNGEIICGEKTIKDAPMIPASTKIKELIDLDIDDYIETQTGLIELAFAQKPALHKQIRWPSDAIDYSSIDEVSKFLISRCFDSRTCPIWPSLFEHDNVPILSPIDFGLYNGSSGIALSLLASGVATKNQETVEFAKDSFGFLTNQLLNNFDKNMLSQGGFNGLWGTLWAISIAGRALSVNYLSELKPVLEELLRIDELASEDLSLFSYGGRILSIALMNDELETTKVNSLLDNYIELVRGHDIEAGKYGFAHGSSGIAYICAIIYQRYRIRNTEYPITSVIQELLAHDYEANRDPNESFGWCKSATSLKVVEKLCSQVFGTERLEFDKLSTMEVNNNTLCHGSDGNDIAMFSLGGRELCDREFNLPSSNFKSNAAYFNYGLFLGISGRLMRLSYDDSTRKFNPLFPGLHA